MPKLWQYWTALRAKTVSVAQRMDWYRGLRAGIALSTPLLLADATGLTHLGWSALGGIEAIVTDAGGPYRSRLARLSVLTLGGALGVFLGTLVGGDLRWALPVTLLFCFGWTYLTALGQPFASASLLVQVIYTCGIGDPVPSVRVALIRAGFLILGGAWATLLSLFLWPLDPYRPARRAVSDCYTELAAFLAGILRAAGSDHAHQANARYKIKVRRLLERAWEAVSSVRAQSQAETARGRQLIVLLETADFVLERTVALAELIEPGNSYLDQFNEVERTLLSIAAILVGRNPTSRLGLAVGPACSKIDRQAPVPGDVNEIVLARQLAEIAFNLEIAHEAATALRLGSRTEPTSEAIAARSIRTASPPSEEWSLTQIWERLAGNWSTKSLVLRHAARVALVCGFDVCLIERRHVGHGYWLVMTSLIVLQPHVSGTLRRSLQRVGGTVGGGILAALLAIVLHSQFVTGIVLFPLALLSLALLPVNYAAFAFFLTPTFVLAFLRHTGDWQLALLRVGNTIAGAAIAIAAMTVLFPSYERERIASFLRASLVANRLYLEELICAWTTECPAGNPDANALALARRATGLALNDVEESLERVLAENWARKTSTETLLAFAAYLHRFSQTVTGAAALPAAAESKRSPQAQALLATIRSRLGWLEDQLSPASNPSAIPWPRLPVETSPRLFEYAQAGQHPTGDSLAYQVSRQLLRLDRQTEVLYQHFESMRDEPWLLRDSSGQV